MKNLSISAGTLEEINRFLTKDSNPIIDRINEIIERHGGADKINASAAQNGELAVLMDKVKKKNPGYWEDLNRLSEKVKSGAFCTLEEYRQERCGPSIPELMDDSFQVTLEISALQYFPWLIAEADKALKDRELLPGRFIRVRAMKEQEEDGDLPAVIAGMKILGSSWVEALDTKGTDGSNLHLNGPDTITGYFGGIGQPNDYTYKWIEEYIYYYMNYGVRQVLNINGGTVLAGYILHKLGVDIEFKISVFVGNDNPLMILWTLLTAKLFSRDDGTTPLIGFNLSNSVNNGTIEKTSEIRKAFGFEKQVRIEHHITESYKSIVRQPYDRLMELTEIAKTVKNISAKHEGGYPEIEKEREHPSDILEYFLPKKDILSGGLMPSLQINYLDKHAAIQRTAQELLKQGIPVFASPKAHHR